MFSFQTTDPPIIYNLSAMILQNATDQVDSHVADFPYVSINNFQNFAIKICFIFDKFSQYFFNYLGMYWN